jgi:hypothetical protein
MTFTRLICAWGDWKSDEIPVPGLAPEEVYEEARRHVKTAHPHSRAGLGAIGTENYQKDPLGRATWFTPGVKGRAE